MQEDFFRKIRFVIAVLFFFTNFAAGKQQDGLSLALRVREESPGSTGYHAG